MFQQAGTTRPVIIVPLRVQVSEIQVQQSHVLPLQQQTHLREEITLQEVRHRAFRAVLRLTRRQVPLLIQAGAALLTAAEVQVRAQVRAQAAVRVVAVVHQAVVAEDDF